MKTAKNRRMIQNRLVNAMMDTSITPLTEAFLIKCNFIDCCSCHKNMAFFISSTDPAGNVVFSLNCVIARPFLHTIDCCSQLITQEPKVRREKNQSFFFIAIQIDVRALPIDANGNNFFFRQNNNFLVKCDVAIQRGRVIAQWRKRPKWKKKIITETTTTHTSNPANCLRYLKFEARILIWYAPVTWLDVRNVRTGTHSYSGRQLENR